MDAIPDDPASARYLNRALAAFAAASPALGALHAIRARRTCPSIELSPLHCPHCGSLAVSSRLGRKACANSRSSRVRNINKGKDKRSQRQQRPPPSSHCTTMQKTCAACGYIDAEAITVVDERVDANPKVHFPKSASANLSSITAQDPPAVQEPISSQRSLCDIDEIIGQPNSADDMKATPTTHSASSKVKASLANALSATTSVERSQETQPLSSSVSKRVKKRSGLQELLARSKEQRRDKEESAPGNGLAAFLSGM